jgi:CHAD domain-containing protein
MRTEQHPFAEPANASGADVLKHLGGSLPLQWRRYRKRLKRCQHRFSETAVHDSRVETRRLLATVELLRAFIAEDKIKKVRRALKRHLDTFDQLRDTQVQLDYVGRMTHSYPPAQAFRDWLRKRETRFARAARRSIKHIRTGRLGRRIAALENEIQLLRKRTPPTRAWETALRAIDRAFARVAQLCRRVRADDTATIHRTRVAFKRFRYMVEALAPLLPAVGDDQRRAMRGYQSMMGDVQDVEVLLAAFAKFVRSQEVDGRKARRLREELLRRRRWLIRVYLNAAGKLRQFWPQPGPSQPSFPPARKRGGPAASPGE